MHSTTFSVAKQEGSTCNYSRTHHMNMEEKDLYEMMHMSLSSEAIVYRCSETRHDISRNVVAKFWTIFCTREGIEVNACVAIQAKSWMITTYHRLSWYHEGVALVFIIFSKVPRHMSERVSQIFAATFATRSDRVLDQTTRRRASDGISTKSLRIEMRFANFVHT